MNEQMTLSSTTANNFFHQFCGKFSNNSPYFCKVKIDLKDKYKLYIDLKVYSYSGCKESFFYSLPFRQAEANIYWPKHHFN